MAEKKRKKKRKLRTWVKVVLVLLCACMIWAIARPFLQKEEHATLQNETVTKEYVTDTDVTIMIDAGHGGMDGGATSLSDKSEKDYTLEYAKQIGTDIQKLNPNIKVAYTRESDEVPWENVYSANYELDDLNGRTRVLNVANPDYILSVHFNSREDASEYGYESYVRGSDSASDTIYTYIAKNLEAIPWSKNNGCWSTEGYPLQIVDLVQSPSMLLELGYLTNKNDVDALDNESTKNKICMAIAKAYCQYIKDNPGASQRQDLTEIKNIPEEILPDDLKEPYKQKQAEREAQEQAQKNEQAAQAAQSTPAP